MMQKGILVVAGLLGVCTCIMKLPNYITLCKESELSTCGLEAARAAFPHLWKGDPTLRLPPVDPALIKEITAVSNSSQSIRLNITFINLGIEGLSTAEIQSVSIKDIGDVKRLKLVVAPKYIHLKGHYKASGKILVLPIVGEGPCETHLERPTLIYELDLKIKKVKGENRVMFVHLYTTPKSKKGSIRFDNLFNGNKLLGDNMNRVMNENWDAMIDQVGTPVFTGIIKEYIPFFVSVFNDIPYKSLFKE